MRASPLVLFVFPRYRSAMPLLDPAPEPVPFEEVAEVLSAAASRVGGGPPSMVVATGAQLASALAAAGFRVVRDAEPGAQLTL
jgi:hypothetical protein